MVIPLNKIKVGEPATIVWLAGSESMSIRLRDLGFTENAAVTCRFRRPKGGMAAYRVANTLIALRQNTAAEIFVRIGKDK